MEVWRCGGGFLLSNAVTRKLFSNGSTCCETRAVPKDDFPLWLQWFKRSCVHSGSTDILQTYLQGSTGWMLAGWSFILLNSRNKKQKLSNKGTHNGLAKDSTQTDVLQLLQTQHLHAFSSQSKTKKKKKTKKTPNQSRHLRSCKREKCAGCVWMGWRIALQRQKN